MILHKLNNSNVYFIALLILVTSIIFVPSSYGTSDLTIEIPRINYSLADSVYISGKLPIATTSDILNLKMYDAGAKLIWSDTIPVGTNDKEYNYKLVLTQSILPKTGFYVLLAEIDKSFASTKFTYDLNQKIIVIPSQNTTLTENQPSIDVKELTKQISQEIISNQKELDIDELAEKVADKLIIPESIINPSVVSPFQNSTILAQSIADKVNSYQQMNVNELAEQIVSLLPPPKEVDNDKLAEQIVSLLPIPQPNDFNVDELSDKIIDKLPTQSITTTNIILPNFGNVTISVEFLVGTVVLFIISISLILYFKFSTLIKKYILLAKTILSKSHKNKITETDSILSDMLKIKVPLAATVKLTDGTEISYEKWKNFDEKPQTSQLNFWIPLLNTDKSILTNISLGITQSTKEIKKQDLLKVNHDLPDLLPNDYCYYPFSISFEEFTTLETIPIFVGITISYKINNWQELQSFDAVYKIDKGTISLIH